VLLITKYDLCVSFFELVVDEELVEFSKLRLQVLYTVVHLIGFNSIWI